MRITIALGSPGALGKSSRQEQAKGVQPIVLRKRHVQEYHFWIDADLSRHATEKKISFLSICPCGEIEPMSASCDVDAEPDALGRVHRRSPGVLPFPLVRALRCRPGEQHGV